MIDTERVKKMTQMALRQKRSGLRLEDTGEPDRKDFMSYYGVRAFFTATIIYVVISLLVALLFFSVVTVKVTRMNLMIALFAEVIGYLFFLLIYTGYARRQMRRRFEMYEQIVKEQRRDLKALEEIYEREERGSHGRQEKTDRDGWDEDRSGDEEPHQ